MIAWLKEKWKWIAGGLLVIGALLFWALQKLLSSKPTVLPPVDTEQKKVEEETNAAEQVAEQKKDSDIARIEAEHSKTIQKLDDEQKKKVEELQENPDELNKFLLDIGKNARS